MRREGRVWFDGREGASDLAWTGLDRAGKYDRGRKEAREN